MSASTTGSQDTSRGSTGELELRDVGIEFANPSGIAIRVVSDFSLSVSAGSLYCLVGRSGSGKTSILRTAAGLVPPMSGTVHWFGRDLETLSCNEIRDTRRKRLGYADQRSHMIPDLSVIENVLIPLLPDGSDVVRRRRDEAESILERLGLADRHHHLPHQLSGGERQRTCLARALIAAPDIVVADEPTASLDRSAADDVIQVLVDYARRHAVLVASHDPHLTAAANQTRQLEKDLPATVSVA